MADARGFQHQEVAAVAGAWLTLSGVRVCTRAFGVRWSCVCVCVRTHTRSVLVDTWLMSRLLNLEILSAEFSTHESRQSANTKIRFFVFRKSVHFAKVTKVKKNGTKPHQWVTKDDP